mmetsp:Transcript_74330/g.197329  ORF Transcript_74330/g.197329 Transcript_74330/m.197329 type:complete len:257 (+) Transcript_74330:1605-2375(+)
MVPQDPDHLVGEVVAVDPGALAHVPVGVRTVGLHGGQDPAKVLEALGERGAHRRSVGVHGVIAVDGLRGALLVPPVLVGLRDAPGPGYAQEPVLVAGNGEGRILGRGVRVVPDYGQDLLTPLLLPLGGILGRHCSAIDKVAVVEVVVIVVAVAEIHARHIQRRALVCWPPLVRAVRFARALAVVVEAPAREEAAPDGVVDKRGLRVLAEPDLYSVGEALHHVGEVRLLGLAQLVRDHHEPREPRQHLARKVRVSNT